MKTQQYVTAPEVLKGVDERHEVFAAAATLQTGVATKYWLELVAYPPVVPGAYGSSLLTLGGTWTIRTMGLRFLSKPRSVIVLSV
jgi:hypothetical protein